MINVETEGNIGATPLSLGGQQKHGSRLLWKTSQLGRSTSTPIEPGPQISRRFQARLDASYLLGESPILPSFQPRLNLAAAPFFGRKDSLEGTRFSTSGVTATLSKMELCDNNNISDSKKMHHLKTDVLKEGGADESTSSFNAHKQFQEQVNKKKKKKLMSPKHKSPKVYKIGIGKKFVGTETNRAIIGRNKKAVLAEKENKNKIKTPKSKKTPHATKINTIKNIITSSSKSSNGSEHPHSKMTKCPKTPKLHTAARAKLKQYREENRKEKEKEMEELKAKQLEEQKRLEELEILKLRQQMVFKAKPIRKYQPLPSVKKRALTDPISPNISKKRRIETSSLTSTHSSNSNRAENNGK